MKTNNKIQLDQLDKSMPFKMPENYFEQFAANMSGQLNRPASKRVPFFTHYRNYIYAAAVFLLLAAIAFPIYQKMQGNSDIMLAEDYKAYIASEIDEDELIEYVAVANYEE